MKTANALLVALPRPIADGLVAGRVWGYRLLTPFDALWRKMNGLGDRPPIWLRRYVGPLASFESSAAEFVCLLKLLAHLKPEHRLLDLGCGCGALALHLRDYVRPELGGSYVGLDVHAPSIRWCQRHLARPGFQFVLLDAYNATFRPDGQRGFDYRAVLSRYAPADVVVAKSLFTHLRPEDTQSYLQAIGGALKPGGEALLTAFLFAPEDDLGKTAIRFAYGDAHFRHAYAHRVESAVAYTESWMQDALTSAGLQLRHLFRGAWRLGGAGLSFQDVILVSRFSD